MDEKMLVNGRVERGASFESAVRTGRSGDVCVGIDIGSTSSDVVVLDERGRVIASDYRRTSGKPIETVYGQLREMSELLNRGNVPVVAVTGSAGRILAELLAVLFVNEVAAQGAAVSHLYPYLRQASVIEMGGQDSKLIFLSSDDGKGRVRDFALNTVCAAGTGSFLDQQAQRLGVDIEGKFGQLALESKTVPRMAGRCSVFAKSDMIHLQQQATPMCDIVAGLCLALARNLKSSLGSGREFVRPIVFTGGVAANIGVVRAIEEVFELSEGELVVPDEHFFTGAIGAVLVAKSRNSHAGKGRLEIEKIDRYLSGTADGLDKAPRRKALSIPRGRGPKSVVYGDVVRESKGKVRAYLGVDVGSISTNVVVMDEQRRILAKEYLMTAGQPLEAVRKGLRLAGEKVGSKVDIVGAATTGSGRYLTGDFIGADIVINEITAQAAGATIVNPAVDTIFEIGGQDSKYISLQNGVVVDFEMNHACAAGTGSFLEEQAQRLEININEEFAETAFKSKAPIKLGERCTVFIESDLLSYQQQGARTEDLVAGLSYSIVANYLNRVVGRRRIGDNICFQGGTAFNKAVWSAFEAVTGKEIMVPDHHEVTGALGAASIAAEHMKSVAGDNGDVVVSGFKGFDSLVSGDYEIKSFKCKGCANECEIKRVELAGSEPLFYGSRCDKYNVKKGKQAEGEFDAFEWRRGKMLEFAGLAGHDTKAGMSRGTIGIPMALVSWQLLPMFSEFFRSLGFEVVVSKWTDKEIIRNGVELVTAQTCFPVKVAYGHVAQLVEKGVDYIFVPSVVSMGSGGCKNRAKQLCPYVQSFVYQVQTAFAGKLGDAEILTAVFRLGEGDKLSAKSFAAVGKQLKASRSSVCRAVERGVGVQEAFEKALKEKGKEIISGVSNDERLFVLVSRPYNGCDDGLNLRLSSKLSQLGVKIIPMDMLDIDGAQLSGGMFNGDVYWAYGHKILRAGGIIKKDKRLFAIYLSNFSCGPDSFLLTFFKDLMGGKPCLQLELDEHSADAGVITRLEAFLESLKHYKYKDASEDGQEHLTRPKVKGNGRKLYVPYMGDGAYGVAACFRAYGQDAEVMPVGDEEALVLGRKFTTGKECLPCAITAGDILSVVNRKDFDAGKSAFFMPGASGPCRFGMYSCLHRMILRQVGIRDAIIISPNQNNNFYQELVGGMGNGNSRGFMKDVWAAAAGVDLLHKVILKLRPFAKDAGEAQRVYDRCVQSWCREVEKRKSLEEMVKVMADIAEKLAGVDLDKSKVKPVIGIVGEIYVRSHRFANSNVIRRLEAFGAGCELASFAEWMYYTAYVRKQDALREGRKWDYLKYVIENIAQHRIERAVARPLEERFGRLADGAIEDVIEAARPYLHHSFEGEAVLSVGKMVEYYHQGLAGVVNVMPFGCMPSTVVSTQTRRISADCGDMPILNLSFDGHEDATLTTRLEAFVEQARERISSKVKV